jgi:hypothetical protein
MELTFGQKAVGLTFNPSGDEKVTKAKQLSADLIDLVENHHNEITDNGNKMSSWIINVFRTAAFNALIASQMAVVKYLTYRQE